MNELNHLTVGMVVEGKGDLISVDTHTSVGNVLDFMEENKLTSIGVHGTPGSWLGAGGVQIVSCGKQYIGLVSAVDLLNFVGSSGRIESSLSANVVSAIGSTNESLSLWSEPLSRPLHVAMEQFCKGCHHALAIDEHQLPKMLSQTDIIRYIYNNRNSEMLHVNQVLDLRLSDISQVEAVTVSSDTTIQDALPLLLQFGALPVLDANHGNLISSVSASDLRGTSSAIAANIYPMTVLDFLFAKHGKIVEPIVLNAQQTVGHAVQTMLSNRIHRVWVLSSEKKLTVISYTDVMRIMYHS